MQNDFSKPRPRILPAGPNEESSDQRQGVEEHELIDAFEAKNGIEEFEYFLNGLQKEMK